MNPKIKAVIFDLDGTLLNTLGDLHASVNAAMTKFGYPTHTKESVRRFVGDGVAMLIERAIPCGRENRSFDACLEYFKCHYAAHMYDHTAAYDGMNEALAILKEKGYLIAVVSNKFDAAVKELCKRYFDGYIDVAIGECEALSIKKKPAPDTVLAALKGMGITNEEAVYVGDSEVDIKTAENCNMECITVSWGFRDKEHLKAHGAYIFADDTAALLCEIEKLG